MWTLHLVIRTVLLFCANPLQQGLQIQRHYLYLSLLSFRLSSNVNKRPSSDTYHTCPYCVPCSSISCNLFTFFFSISPCFCTWCNILLSIKLFNILVPWHMFFFYSPNFLPNLWPFSTSFSTHLFWFSISPSRASVWYSQAVFHPVLTRLRHTGWRWSPFL